MQKVEIYYDILSAKYDMENYIHSGWRVHTCAMGCYEAGCIYKEKVIVVYEK